MRATTDATHLVRNICSTQERHFGQKAKSSVNPNLCNRGRGQGIRANEI
jgi:hypothetical protein